MINNIKFWAAKDLYEICIVLVALLIIFIIFLICNVYSRMNKKMEANFNKRSEKFWKEWDDEFKKESIPILHVDKSPIQYNIEEFLERAQVSWSDDIISGTRIVLSENKEAPLTENEKATLIRMWSNQFSNSIMPLLIFKVAGEEN